MQIVMLAVLFLVVMFIAGWIFFRYTMTREGLPMPGKPRITEDNPDLRAWEKYRPLHDADVKWFESQTMEDVRIMSGGDGFTVPDAMCCLSRSAPPETVKAPI